MPIAKALAALRAAIESEGATAHSCKAAYIELLDRIVSYQLGDGPPPTDEEFKTWRDAARHLIDLRKAGVAANRKFCISKVRCFRVRAAAQEIA